MKNYNRFITLFFIFILSISLIACGSDDKNKGVDENSPPEKVEYFIRRVDDNKKDGERFYAYNVLITEKASKASLKEVALEVTKIAEEKTPFDYLSIRFYDGPQYIDSNSNIYNLGFVDATRKEIPVQGDDGEEATMTSHVEFSFHIKDKDWDKQISKEEMDIVNRLYELIDINDISTIGPAAHEVGDKFGKTYDEVIQIFGKQLDWELNDLDSSYDIHNPQYDVFDRLNKEEVETPKPKEDPKVEEEKQE